jgi:hypothetical protein
MNAPFDINALSRTPERLAPHNIELEQALLGAILINNEAYTRFADFLEADHFYEAAHAEIFEIAVRLIRDGARATPITVKQFLPADMRVGDLTANQYLARLVAEATTIINAPDYARNIVEHAGGGSIGWSITKARICKATLVDQGVPRLAHPRREGVPTLAVQGAPTLAPITL